MLVIVDYMCANVGSIRNMLRKAGAPNAVVSSQPAVIAKAKKLILPGVGSYDTGMSNIRKLGILDVLNERVLEARVPVLGICLGMQLMTESSEEGMERGLGWIKGRTMRISLGSKSSLKVPHMGWNSVRLTQDIPLVRGFAEDFGFYFVHSFHVQCSEEANVVGWTTHGQEFASIIAMGNIMGTQFHPEKSHKNGLHLLKNFVEGV